MAAGSFRSGYFLEQLEGSGPPQVDAAALAVGCGDKFGYGARPMEIQVRVQMLPVKPIHRLGVLRIDVAEANVLADDGSVLGFHQAVVAALMRSRLGLFDVQFFQ